ncbi:pancreatic secretory granule membrane major glycoprotein GP2-like [Melospiza georgiana]|uniref:pancreatic secretory granule membrane major glycoprotein GP2-like n=1 Tax=Melospiza georgiana TaxID=44398 RepID=UPI0025ACE57E|nr:pancreatic secretory granule membrane major glycoprotein GP2-like [Melospiza georgiana]
MFVDTLSAQSRQSLARAAAPSTRWAPAVPEPAARRGLGGSGRSAEPAAPKGSAYRRRRGRCLCAVPAARLTPSGAHREAQTLPRGPHRPRPSPHRGSKGRAAAPAPRGSVAHHGNARGRGSVTGPALLGTGLGAPRDGARGFSWTGPRLLGTGPRLSRTGPAVPPRPDPAGTPSGSPQTSRHSPRPRRFPRAPAALPQPRRLARPGRRHRAPGPLGEGDRAEQSRGQRPALPATTAELSPSKTRSETHEFGSLKIKAIPSELASSHGPGPGVALRVRRSPDACLPNPCQHQGQCQVPVDRPVCSCKPGFTGEFCQDVVLKLACEEEHMKMMVRKEVFELLKIPLELVHLKNQACKVSEKEEEGELFFAAVLTGENHTACGSVIQQNSSHVSYSNAIESEQEAPRAPISRSFQLEVHFSCIYAYQQVVRLPFALTAVDKLVQLVVREGHFNVSMRLYKSPSYLEPYHLPSVAVPLTDTLYVLLKMEGQHQLKYFLLSVLDCWATPSPDPHQDTQHKLIEQGCPHDETVTYLNAIGESTSAKFSFQMFQFVGYPEMFLHCRVQLCVPDSPEPCAKQCPRHGRSRRALADDHNRIVSYGPILLLAAPPSGADIHRSSSDQQDPAGPSPWLSRALILLGVLTVLAVAAVAVSVRRRMG